MRLRIATFNAWALPWPAARDVASRLAAIGNGLAGLAADAVAFQEVWTRGARERLVDAGRAAGLTEVWHARHGLGGGLLVLARLPLAGATFERFTARGVAWRIWHGDARAGKGFCVLGLGGGPPQVSLVTTHLHGRYRPGCYPEHQDIRLAQAAQLAARVRDLAGPVIVAGDLNCGEGDSEYRLMAGTAGLTDVAARLGLRQPTLLAANPYNRARGWPDQRIDYVFVRDGGGATVHPVALYRVFDQVVGEDGSPAACSDHAGLLAELEVTEDGGGGTAPVAPGGGGRAPAGLSGPRAPG